jgi:tRNA nucleotidyltransferase/poly(A) polymerase
MRFQTWLESSLRDQLLVPQNPKHHPEGHVARHTYMVRSSLPKAIELLQKQQLIDQSLSNLDLNFNQNDMNILRLAALLHDIGKSVTTDPVKLTAYGHDEPQNFEKAMQSLGPTWQKMYANSSPEDKADLWFMIQHHMGLHDTDGFRSHKLKVELMDQDGKYKNERKIKLLLVLLLMDRMGRGGSKDFDRVKAKQFSLDNTVDGLKGLNGIGASSQWMKDRTQKILANQNKPSANDPLVFVQELRTKGKSNEVIKQALLSKFKLSPENIIQLVGESMNFQAFMEANDPKSQIAKISLPNEIFQLKRLFQSAGKHLYVVGGAVRDSLMGLTPKDIDLCTDATPKKVGEILTRANIRNFEKGEAFGVWVAHINGEDYEIATLREDSAGGDGRRPDQVTYTNSLAKDHARRDLTINGLYYEIPDSPNESGRVIDHASGIDDIQNKKVKVIGDPYARFGEDRLRISRIPRFHSRWNENPLDLDARTLDAINHYKDLNSPSRYYTPEGGHAHDIGPVSAERIQQEFLSGIMKSKNTASFLKTYEQLGLFPAVFPGLKLDMDAVDRLHSVKDPILLLAVLLRQNSDARQIKSKLTALKYPNEITDEVSFLIHSWQTAKKGDPNEMILRSGDMIKKPERRQLVGDFGKLVNDIPQNHWGHFAQYEPAIYSGEDIARDYGIKPGPAMGQKIRELQANRYRDSYQKYLDNLPKKS